MTNTKKKIWMIAGSAVLVVAAVLIGLYATGNLFGTPSEPDYAAYLVIDGRRTNYMTAAEAWSAIPTDKYCEMYLLKDWLADSQGNMGYGTGFSNGIIVVRERSKNLNLNLNGHTINRGLYDPSKNIDNPREAGSVFYFCSDATLAVSNGTIRGGNAIGDGGAFYFGGDKHKGRLRLYDITLKYNKADNGSAIYYRDANTQELSLTDVTITENYCNQNYGGAMTNQTYGNHDGFYMHGKIIIKDNYGVGTYGKNLSLRCPICECETLSTESNVVFIVPPEPGSDKLYGSNRITYELDPDDHWIVRMTFHPELGDIGEAWGDHDLHF